MLASILAQTPHAAADKATPTLGTPDQRANTAHTRSEAKSNGITTTHDFSDVLAHSELNLPDTELTGLPTLETLPPSLTQQETPFSDIEKAIDALLGQAQRQPDIASHNTDPTDAREALDNNASVIDQSLTDTVNSPVNTGLLQTQDADAAHYSTNLSNPSSTAVMGMQQFHTTQLTVNRQQTSAGKSHEMNINTDAHRLVGAQDVSSHPSLANNDLATRDSVNDTPYAKSAFTIPVTAEGLTHSLVKTLPETATILQDLQQSPTSVTHKASQALQDSAKMGEQMLAVLRNQVVTQLQQQQQQTTIRLDPPELGSLEIFLQHESGKITVNISASHADVAKMLQQTSDRLRSELVQQAFVEVNVDIQQGHSHNQQQQHQDDVLDNHTDIDFADNLQPHQSDDGLLVTV